MKYYLIEFENGVFRCGYFSCYSVAFNYACSLKFGCDFTISEYDSEESYFNNI